MIQKIKNRVIFSEEERIGKLLQSSLAYGSED